MRDTLERIYGRHRQGLFVLALSITRSATDAEDAVHEAFTRLCRNGQTMGSDPVAYVFGAVRNAAVDRVRWRKPETCTHVSLAPCLETADDAAAMQERDKAIAEAVDALPEDMRSVVFLRIFSGLTFRQIGELMDTPLPTVVSRFTRALERLQPQLRKWQ